MQTNSFRIFHLQPKALWLYSECFYIKKRLYELLNKLCIASYDWPGPLFTVKILFPMLKHRLVDVQIFTNFVI